MNKRRLFGKKVASTNTELNSLPVPKQSNIYRSITTLPLNRFIDVVVDGNLYALVETPDNHTVTIEDLTVVWSGILSEYTEAIGNAEYKHYVSVYKELSAIKLKYSLIIQAIDILKTGVYSKIICDFLNSELKCNCVFNYKDEKSYINELDKCFRRSKSIKIQIDLKQLQFDAVASKHKEGKKPDRKYYDAVLISLSDHAKYEIRDDITVSKFCERINRLNKHYETLKSK